MAVAPLSNSHRAPLFNSPIWCPCGPSIGAEPMAQSACCPIAAPAASGLS